MKDLQQKISEMLEVYIISNISFVVGKHFQKASLFTIDSTDMLNYIVLEYATALVNMKRLRWYWSTKNTYNGLLGSEFFKQTMSLGKFLLIRRHFQADLDQFMEHYHNVSAKYYTPSGYICMDDDLEKCECKSSETIICKVKLLEQVFRIGKWLICSITALDLSGVKNIMKQKREVIL
jgi:hypothetical protein